MFTSVKFRFFYTPLWIFFRRAWYIDFFYKWILHLETWKGVGDSGELNNTSAPLLLEKQLKLIFKAKI